MARASLLALIATFAVVSLTSCGTAPEPPPEPPAEVATVRCPDAVLNKSDPRWREQSTAVGPFGLYGPGRDFDNARALADGTFVTKLPAIVEGQTAVTVRVSSGQPNGVLLHYGYHHPSEALTFEPCAQAITSWSGEMILESRQPATLEVQVGDDPPKTLLVGSSASWTTSLESR